MMENRKEMSAAKKTGYNKALQSKAENIIFHSLNTLLMLLLAFITLYPFWNTIAVSFNEALDTIRGGITILPRKFTTYNYKVIFSAGTIFHALGVYPFMQRHFITGLNVGGVKE